MTIQQELLLRAISSFCENGIAQFTWESFKDVCSYNKAKTLYAELKKNRIITDTTINGYAHRCTLQPLECPNFIFEKELSFRIKCKFLQIWQTRNEEIQITSYHPFYETLRVYSKKGWAYKNICNAPIIKNTFTTSSLFKCTENGIIVYEKGSEIKELHCLHCGETNPTKFTHSKSICDHCYETSIDKISRQLYKRSKHNSKHYFPKTYNLTPSFIKELYNKQEGKCAYSGEELQCWDTDKYHKITLDRIDPNKGYTQDNVCLCTQFVNMMKNNATLEQFKQLIDNIHTTLHASH